MARLSITSPGFENRSLDLHLGANSFGRSKDNDWQISHATISSRHCEIHIEAAGVRVTDCGSTNGTFVNDEPVKEMVLAPGQRLRMGDVEFLVEDVDVKIAIPKFEAVPAPEPPAVLSTGEMACPNHPESAVTLRCKHCEMLMCDACVKNLRRRGGKLLRLCPICSHAVEPLVGEVKRRKTFIDYLRNTVKMPFFRNHANRD
jgi:pSer/pThr/pTyr-binding forkhead associated (FHA) protein